MVTLLTKSIQRFPLTFFLFCCALWLGMSSSLQAQVTFTVEAPSSVALSQRFTVKFMLNNAWGTEFTPPEVEGASTLFSPQNATSQASSNGRKSQVQTGTYLPERVGVIRFTAATIKVKGKVYKTKPFTIKVLADEKQRKGATQQQAATDMFIRAIPSKTTLYEQEPLLITYKLYTRNSRIEIENVKFPAYDGFVEQPVERPRNIQLSLEDYNGKHYSVALLHQTYLFPQRSGTLQIPQGEFDILAAVEQQIDSEEDFFNLSTIAQVRKRITSPSLRIEVKPLPTPAPDGFGGAVGQFTLQEEWSEGKKAQANDQVDYTLTIRGSGNLKYFKTPERSWPESFDSFPPKSDTEVTATSEGVSGSRSLHYYAIPRNIGAIKIAPIQFVYFDPSIKQYKTLQTAPHVLQVEKSDHAGVYAAGDHSDVAILGEDISPLLNLSQHDSGNVLRFLLYHKHYYVCLALLLLALLGGWGWHHYRLRTQDLIGKRKRAAARVAQKHLRQAASLAHSDSNEAFYQALLQALYGFVADKFLLDRSQLTQSYVTTVLREAHVEPTTVETLIAMLKELELVRFSPQGASRSNTQMLQQAEELIQNLQAYTRS